MKKVKKILIYTVVLAIIFNAVIPTFKFRYYYYSKDSSKVLTRITWGNTWFLNDQTYMTPGYYSRWKLPGTYIKPIYSNDHDWAEIVIMHSEGIYIHGSGAEVKNLNKEFLWYNDSFTDYNYARKLDSLEKALKNPEKFSVYSFD